MAIQQVTFLGRAVHPSGHGCCAIGIPSDVQHDLDLEPGKGGDLVDMEYDREEETLTIHF